MSDYTEIFKEYANSDTFVISRSLLEEYKQKAAAAERQRIIQLITDKTGSWSAWTFSPEQLIEMIERLDDE